VDQLNQMYLILILFVVIKIVDYSQPSKIHKHFLLLGYFFNNKFLHPHMMIYNNLLIK
jgi:hypothetical protein